jgi:hypothetical protein
MSNSPDTRGVQDDVTIVRDPDGRIAGLRRRADGSLQRLDVFALELHLQQRARELRREAIAHGLRAVGAALRRLAAATGKAREAVHTRRAGAL